MTPLIPEKPNSITPDPHKPDSVGMQKCPDCHGHGWSWHRFGARNTRAQCWTGEGEGEIRKDGDALCLSTKESSSAGNAAPVVQPDSAAVTEKKETELKETGAVIEPRSVNGQMELQHLIQQVNWRRYRGVNRDEPMSDRFYWPLEIMAMHDISHAALAYVVAIEKTQEQTP